MRFERCACFRLSAEIKKFFNFRQRDGNSRWIRMSNKMRYSCTQVSCSLDLVVTGKAFSRIAASKLSYKCTNVYMSRYMIIFLLGITDVAVIFVISTSHFLINSPSFAQFLLSYGLNISCRRIPSVINCMSLIIFAPLKSLYDFIFGVFFICLQLLFGYF